VLIERKLLSTATEDFQAKMKLKKEIKIKEKQRKIA
jgi:hypothetical protein